MKHETEKAIDFVPEKFLPKGITLVEKREFLEGDKAEGEYFDGSEYYTVKIEQVNAKEAENLINRIRKTSGRNILLECSNLLLIRLGDEKFSEFNLIGYKRNFLFFVTGECCDYVLQLASLTIKLLERKRKPV